MDTNQALTLLKEKNWKLLFKVLEDDIIFEELISDNIFKEIFERNLIPEFLNNVNCETEEHFLYLSKLNDIHNSTTKNFTLSNKQHLQLTLELLKSNRDYHLAKMHPENPICKEIIEEYHKIEEKKSKKESDSAILISKLEIQEFTSTNQIFSKKSIFKSPQELEFYNAAKKVFKGMIILPNAALSTVIPSILIGPEIKYNKWFYLTTTIDCVVVETKTFIPIYFFELDSKIHDLEDQKEKDEVKNTLINAAGHKLYRIRKKEFENHEKSFEYFELYLRKLINKGH
jgi:hypothetical protein